MQWMSDFGEMLSPESHLLLGASGAHGGQSADNRVSFCDREPIVSSSAWGERC